MLLFKPIFAEVHNQTIEIVLIQFQSFKFKGLDLRTFLR